MNKAQQLAERLKRYIPSRDGYNSEFANDLAEAVEYLSQDELIAQRDELLEALEAALPLLHTGDELPLSYYKDKPSILGKALQAIAKAKGEV